MLLNMDEIRELIHLLDETSLAEIRIEYEDVKLHLKKYHTEGASASHRSDVHLVTGQASPPVSISSQLSDGGQVATDASAVVESPLASDDGAFTMTSPMVGTFYRSPSPDDPVFVEVGSKVTEKSVLCIVEAMKLMNEIEAEVSGEVVEILAKSGDLVEYGQPLFKIRLS